MTVHSRQLNRDIMDPALTVKGEDGGAIPTVTVRLYRGLHAKGPCGPFSFHPKFMTVVKGAMQRDVTATKYIYMWHLSEQENFVQFDKLKLQQISALAASFKLQTTKTPAYMTVT